MAQTATQPSRASDWYELITLPVPYALWFYSFGPFPPGFWVKLSTSGLILLLIALTRRRRVRLHFSFQGLAIGVASAVLLYLLFWAGYQVMSAVPGFTGTISSVYSLSGGAPKPVIAGLLLFPIGPAEEFYWRGFIQRRLKGATTPTKALVASSVIYASIHLVTLNPSLLLVALIGGMVWGAIYEKCSDLFPVLVSHILFDELIFVLFVIG
ncbi:MAG TPA: type II CAAX endopeptidase family protein [Nitrososphaerales archaeon]|nr:type II CAAX endopeptidase family protein [Nitrososphaerales archaeon]